MDSPSQYRGYGFPPEVISHSVWLYHRFCLSFRDIEDLLAERGVTVSYETIRQWCKEFGPSNANTLRKRAGRLGDTWLLDEVHIVTIQGSRHYLWRAVDQESNVIDILVQKRKDKRAAKRYFRKMLNQQGQSPRRLVTDKLPSYVVAKRDLMQSVALCRERYANNQVESRYLNSRHEKESDRCAGSSPLDGHSDFSRCSDVFRICFAKGDILCAQPTIALLGAQAFRPWREITYA